MASKWFVVISLYFYLIFYRIHSRESSLQCWRCEVTIQSSKQAEVFLDDCEAHFDFTQHTREDCNGKCWKSVDLIDIRQQFENRTHDQSLIKYKNRSKLKSSRRCFSVDELIRAAELGINTSDGCRQLRSCSRCCSRSSSRCGSRCGSRSSSRCSSSRCGSRSGSRGGSRSSSRCSSSRCGSRSSSRCCSCSGSHCRSRICSYRT
ncbi:unnamed protein product [Rotaria sp. Silwood1]|nr:unnamed protein product [Rotaria sp. Silwood1]